MQGLPPPEGYSGRSRPAPHDSQTQRDDWVDILAKVSDELGTPWEPRSWPLADRARGEIDGVDADATVCVAIYSRIGRLKVPNCMKVAKDVCRSV